MRWDDRFEADHRPGNKLEQPRSLELTKTLLGRASEIGGAFDDHDPITHDLRRYSSTCASSPGRVCSRSPICSATVRSSAPLSTSVIRVRARRESDTDSIRLRIHSSAYGGSVRLHARAR